MGVYLLGARRRAFFLDDGVLNKEIVRDEKPYPPAGPDEVEVFPACSQSWRCSSGSDSPLSS